MSSQPAVTRSFRLDKLLGNESLDSEFTSSGSGDEKQFSSEKQITDNLDYILKGYEHIFSNHAVREHKDSKHETKQPAKTTINNIDSLVQSYKTLFDIDDSNAKANKTETKKQANEKNKKKSKKRTVKEKKSSPKKTEKESKKKKMSKEDSDRKETGDIKGLTTLGKSIDEKDAPVSKPSDYTVEEKKTDGKVHIIDDGANEGEKKDPYENIGKTNDNATPNSMVKIDGDHNITPINNTNETYANSNNVNFNKDNIEKNQANLNATEGLNKEQAVNETGATRHDTGVNEDLKKIQQAVPVGLQGPYTNRQINGIGDMAPQGNPLLTGPPFFLNANFSMVNPMNSPMNSPMNPINGMNNPMNNDQGKMMSMNNYVPSNNMNNNGQGMGGPVNFMSSPGNNNNGMVSPDAPGDYTKDGFPKQIAPQNMNAGYYATSDTYKPIVTSGQYNSFSYPGNDQGRQACCRNEMPNNNEPDNYNNNGPNSNGPMSYSTQHDNGGPMNRNDSDDDDSDDNNNENGRSFFSHLTPDNDMPPMVKQSHNDGGMGFRVGQQGMDPAAGLMAAHDPTSYGNTMGFNGGPDSNPMMQSMQNNPMIQGFHEQDNNNQLSTFSLSQVNSLDEGPTNYAPGFRMN